MTLAILLSLKAMESLQNGVETHFVVTPLLSTELNSIRLGRPAQGIVTKMVHKTLPGMVGVKGVERVVVGAGLVRVGGLGVLGLEIVF